MNITVLDTTELNALSGWFSPPKLRGTADIIWSCLTTLFICVWVALHLNIPAKGESRTTLALRKFKWMVIGLLAPEVVTWYAAHQWYRARKSSQAFLEHGLIRWSVTHAFYANMGGFVVDTGADSQSIAIDAEDTLALLQSHTITLPDTTIEDIRDKSKADGLGKTIACVQAGWIVIQCFARAAQRLPMTTLELATLGHVLCALVTYCFWWNKPFNVMVPTVIGPIPEPKISAIIGYSIECRLVMSGQTRSRIANNRYTLAQGLWVTLPPFLMISVFGGIHCIAWNFVFPTKVEQLLWRISAISVTALGTLMLFMVEVTFRLQAQSRLEAPSRFEVSWRIGALNSLFIFLYVIIRSYMIVEIFIGLRMLPVGVYQGIDWISFVPYL